MKAPFNSFAVVPLHRMISVFLPLIMYIYNYLHKFTDLSVLKIDLDLYVIIDIINLYY